MSIQGRFLRWRHLGAVLCEALAACLRNPAYARQTLRNLPAVFRSRRLGTAWKAPAGVAERTPEDNPLWDYFANHTIGRGIFKWRHYFEAYHRHLARVAQRPVHVVEVGVLGGGSLDMWSNYFGAQCQVYGIDIMPESARCARDNIHIFIGDQQDRRFWASFKAQVPQVDVFIDDGGHTPEQQMVTLEEMLPHLRPGGVYICEDIHGISNTFAAFATGLIFQLNEIHGIKGHVGSATSPYQQVVHSIHFYPYLMVIETHSDPPALFHSSRQGTEWPKLVNHRIAT